jgi:hypothetical protein
LQYNPQFTVCDDVTENIFVLVRVFFVFKMAFPSSSGELGANQIKSNQKGLRFCASENRRAVAGNWETKASIASRAVYKDKPRALCSSDSAIAAIRGSELFC